MVGFNPKNPTKYAGTDKYITFFVTRNREPTSADYRQPETGALYSVGTVWQVGKNPTTGVEGELWMLSKIVSNVAYWIQIVGSSGPALEFQVDAATAPGVNPVTPDGAGLTTITADVVAAHSIPLRTHTTALNQYTIEAQYSSAINSTDATKVGFCAFDDDFFTVDPNGFVQPTSLLTKDLHWPKFIVGDTANGANYSTIAAALTAASSGDTIALQPGTYTENLTLKAGVDIVGLQPDPSTPNVTIIGKLSASFSGTCTIASVRLQDNNDNIIEITGTDATQIYLKECNINVVNNIVAFDCTSTSASALVQLDYCNCSLNSATASYFAFTGGQMRGNYTRFINNLNSVVANTLTNTSNGGFTFCTLNICMSTADSASIGIRHSVLRNAGGNTTILTLNNSSNTNSVSYSIFESGSASAIVSDGAASFFCTNCEINSSNTNAIAGAGSITYTNLMFTSTSQKISTTTQLGGVAKGGVTQAPSAGFIGEQIRATRAGGGSALALTTATAADVTSISLTAGIWDVSACCIFGGGPITGTVFEASINTTSATRGTSGDNAVGTNLAPAAAAGSPITIPSYRITLTTTTTVYLVAYAEFTVGATTAFGRISATRVG